MTQVIELKTSTVNKLESTLADLRSEFEEDKKTLSYKYDTLSKESSQKIERLMESNIINEKDLALAKQQNSFKILVFSSIFLLKLSFWLEISSFLFI